MFDQVSREQQRLEAEKLEKWVAEKRTEFYAAPEFPQKLLVLRAFEAAQRLLTK